MGVLCMDQPIWFLWHSIDKHQINCHKKYPIDYLEWSFVLHLEDPVMGIIPLYSDYTMGHLAILRLYKMNPPINVENFDFNGVLFFE